MREWHYKRDGDAGPRHFLSHRELLWWAVTRVGRYSGVPVVMSLVLIVYEFSGSGGYSRFFTGLIISGSMILLWMGVSAGIHLYITLSSGVMSRDERARLGRGDL